MIVELKGRLICVNGQRLRFEFFDSSKDKLSNITHKHADTLTLLPYNDAEFVVLKPRALSMVYKNMLYTLRIKISKYEFISTARKYAGKRVVGYRMLLLGADTD